MSGVIAAIGVGTAVSYYGQQQSARAAQGAADAQAQQARENRAAIMAAAARNRQEATALSGATPQELNILGQAYDAAGKQLTQQQRLMESIDPSLMEASKQALDILRGGTADINKPMNSMRAAQRAQLVNSLRAQYGPGAESTSLGQKHLQSFDMQTNSMFQQNQQNSLSQLMGIATNPAPGQNFQRSISGLEEIGQGYGNLQTRQLNTSINMGAQELGALSGVSQQMLNTAGSQYVGASLQGQGMAQLGNTGMQLGAMYGMYGKRGGSIGGGLGNSGAGAVNSAPQDWWVPDAEQASAGTGRYS